MATTAEVGDAPLGGGVAGLATLTLELVLPGSDRLEASPQNPAPVSVPVQISEAPGSTHVAVWVLPVPCERRPGISPC